jgi:hypothetical protein
LLVYVDLSSGKDILLVSVLPSVNTQEGLELADDGILVL